LDTAGTGFLGRWILTFWFLQDMFWLIKDTIQTFQRTKGLFSFFIRIKDQKRKLTDIGFTWNFFDIGLGLVMGFFGYWVIDCINQLLNQK
jgi:hypothetical protein